MEDNNTNQIKENQKEINNSTETNSSKVKENNEVKNNNDVKNNNEIKDNNGVQKDTEKKKNSEVKTTIILLIIVLVLVLGVGIGLGFLINKNKGITANSTNSANAQNEAKSNTNFNGTNNVNTTNSTESSANPTTSQNGIKIIYNTKVVKEMNEGNAKYICREQLPQIQGLDSTATRRIEESLKSWYSNEWKNINEQNSDASIKVILSNQGKNYESYEIGFTQSFKASYVNDKIITFDYSLEGGIGGVSWGKASGITFDIKTGDVIEIKDVVKSKESYISECKKFVMEELKKDSRYQEVIKMHGNDYESIVNSAIEKLNGYFTEKGIVCVEIPRYTIATGASGEFRYVIPYSNIKEYIKSEYDFSNSENQRNMITEEYIDNTKTKGTVSKKNNEEKKDTQNNKTEVTNDFSVFESFANRTYKNEDFNTTAEGAKEYCELKFDENKKPTIKIGSKSDKNTEFYFETKEISNLKSEGAAGTSHVTFDFKAWTPGGDTTGSATVSFGNVSDDYTMTVSAKVNYTTELKEYNNIKVKLLGQTAVESFTLTRLKNRKYESDKKENEFWYKVEFDENGRPTITVGYLANSVSQISDTLRRFTDVTMDTAAGSAYVTFSYRLLNETGEKVEGRLRYSNNTDNDEIYLKMNNSKEDGDGVVLKLVK